MKIVDEKYENIAKLAQKHVADYPVIVIGSGLSTQNRLEGKRLNSSLMTVKKK